MYVEVAYKTPEGMRIVKYEGKVNMMQGLQGTVTLSLVDGSQIVIVLHNIYYYKVIR